MADRKSAGDAPVAAGNRSLSDLTGVVYGYANNKRIRRKRITGKWRECVAATTATGRTYEKAAAMLMTLDIVQIGLLTRNGDKVEALTGFGISVSEVVPTKIYMNNYNRRYIETKEERRDELRHGVVSASVISPMMKPVAQHKLAE